MMSMLHAYCRYDHVKCLLDLQCSIELFDINIDHFKYWLNNHDGHEYYLFYPLNRLNKTLYIQGCSTQSPNAKQSTWLGWCPRFLQTCITLRINIKLQGVPIWSAAYQNEIVIWKINTLAIDLAIIDISLENIVFNFEKFFLWMDPPDRLLFSHKNGASLSKLLYTRHL